MRIKSQSTKVILFLYGFLGVIIRFLACVLIGTILMVLVYLIPTDNIELNVANSAELFEKEGVYPSYNLDNLNSVRDNYTDAWMLLEAAYNDEKSALSLSMANYTNFIDQLNPVESLVKHYKYGDSFTEVVLYGRYWNGYLIYLKPLLFFFGYSSIRYINSIVQILLFCIIIFLLKKKKKTVYIIPYILSVLLIMPFSIVLNIQQSTCYTLFNLGIIAILLFSEQLPKKDFFIFMYLGIATSFFDLLSYPLVTFGVPAVFYFCLLEKEGIKQTMLRLFKIGAAWCFGYGGMWVCKWFIGSLLSGENLIMNGINQVLFRAGSNSEIGDSGAESFSKFTTIRRNVSAFLETPAVYVFAAFIVVMTIILIVLILKTKNPFIDCVKISLPYMLLAFAPFVWYVLIRNHSAIHYYIFANKELLITAMSLSCLCIKLYSYLRKKLDDRERL